MRPSSRFHQLAATGGHPAPLLCLFVLLASPIASLAQLSPSPSISSPSNPSPPSQTPGQISSRALDPLAAPSSSTSLLAQPDLTPGALFLMDLERRFAQAVSTGGGKAFATWFAEDAVNLSNGRPVLLGRGAIAAGANWDPRAYQLTWTPAGARMGPSNDMGFTWGHWDGRSTDAQGQQVSTGGRYITVWKKLPDNTWRVTLDASASEPPATGDCCALPKP